MNKNDLVDCFKEITPSPTQKQKMLKIILDSRKGGTVPLKRTTKRLSLTAAVVAICILTTTTALAISLGWNEKLIEYLKPSEEQMETLSGAVNIPEATVTQNGVTITVKQTLADSFGVYVLYEMTVPEDIELNDDIQWKHGFLKVPKKTDEATVGGVYGADTLEQTGNKRTVLYHLQATAPLENGEIELNFGDLGYYKVTGDPKGPTPPDIEFVPLVEGEWDLKWEFSYVDTSKTVEANKPLSINGSEDTISKVVISPMSVCAFVKGDDILMSGVRPTVNFKDGSQIAYDVNSKNKSFGYYLIDEANLIYQNQLYYRFENIINVDDVESITVGDVTIPIE
ncbi:hypothetical protein Psch_02528 [Pelotomaculum schinkii]|uniref:DUF4179 domain-containing protein n=1 Tax=Pelotomaculum schinkii TaxID=78350 RepID=A0A4Y7R9K2_9FIRM|nr:DUF4179 domain-containing protein [Pelotomaculum schinkii]TEB05487.1 hypothetical protein Psch_02528 [Pelotomaculum schinkii]